MKINTHSRYAVMAMVDLAVWSKGNPIRLVDVAQRQEVSPSYLGALFVKLRRSGLVTSVRGPRGGYSLARSAAETRISDIIIAVDGPFQTLPDMNDPTHDLWQGLENQFFLYLDSISLEDVVEKRVLGSSGHVYLQGLG